MPLDPTKPAAYRDIQDKFNELQQTHPDLVSGMTLHDYSQHLNEQTGTNNFNAGLNPNIIKDASAGVDRALDATGVTDLTGGVGRALGGLISPGAADVGEEYGRGFVRPLVAGAAGAVLGSLVAPGVGTAAGAEAGAEAAGAGEAVGTAAQLAQHAWRVFGSNVGYGANQGVQTYTDTGSAGAGVAAGALGYLTEGFGRVGETAAARLVGTKIGSTLTEEGARKSTEGVLPTLAEMATEKFGMTAGLAVNNEVTRQAVNLALGKGLTMPSTSDAITDVAQAAAPLVLGVGHDLVGLHDAQQSGRDTRSVSESMNLVEAAQKIRTEQIQQEVRQAAVAADTTLTQTKKADILRAGAIDSLLTPQDAAEYNRMEAEGGGQPQGLPVDKRQTALGTPIRDLGVSADLDRLDNEGGGQPMSKPINQPAQGEQTNEPQAKESTTQGGAGGQTNTQPPTQGQLAEKVGSNLPVEQSSPTQQPVAEKLLEAVQQVADRSPVTPTLESIIKRVKMLNRSSDIPTLDNFKNLVHAHVELMKQISEHAQIRNLVNVEPITDAELEKRVVHLMSPAGGSMKAVDALYIVHQTTKTYLLDKYKEMVATLRETNEAKFKEDEAAQAKVVEAATAPTAKNFLTTRAMHGPYAEEINRVLESNPEVPTNTAVAIERWVRQTNLNNDPAAREMLKTITSVQKTQGRILKPDELETMLHGQANALSHDSIDDIKDLFNRAGIMWTKTGELSERSRLRLLLKDRPDRPELGQWNIGLEQYLSRSAAREKTGEEGTVSLDKSHTEDGETTLAHTDLGGEIAQTARERHVDPVAQETAKQLADVRLQQTRAIRDRIAQMGVGRPHQTDSEMARVMQKSGITVKDDLTRFKRLLVTWADAHSLLPEQRQVPEKPNSKGGVDTWLEHGEQGTHTEWKLIGASNFPRWKKMCREFYDAFTQLDANGVPQIRPEFQDPNWYKQPGELRPLTVLLGQPKDAQGFVKTKEGENAQIAPHAGIRIQPTYETAFKPGPDREQQVVLGMRSWFGEYLKQSGLDENSPMYGRYLDSMTRTAMIFPQIDKVRVGGIVKRVGELAGDDNIGGVSFRKLGLTDSGQFSRIINLVGMSYSKYSKDASTNTFLKNVTAAHEFNHAVFNAKKDGQLSPQLSARMDAALEDVKNMSYEDRSAILNTLRQHLLPEEITKGRTPEASEIMRQVQGWINYGAKGGVNVKGDDPEEFLSVMFGMAGLGIANPSKTTASLRNLNQLKMFIPDRLREFQQAYYTDLLHYTNALKGYFNEHTAGLGDRYFQIADMYQQLTRTPDQIDSAMRSLHEMESLQPEQFIQLASDSQAPDMMVHGIGTKSPGVTFVNDLNKIYSLDISPEDTIKASTMLKQARDMIMPDPKMAPIYGHDPGFWSLFTPLAQFAERFPVMRPLADTLLSFQGYVNSANAQALSPFAMTEKNGKMVKTENLDALVALKNNPVTRAALNSLLLWQNEKETLVTAENIGKLAPSLSPDQQKKVLQTLNSLSASMMTSGQGTINASLASCGHLIGSLAMNMEREHAMSAKTGEQLGTNLMRALTGLRSPDPATQEMSQELLKGVMAQMEPATGVHVLQMAQDLAEKHSKLVNLISNRPWYSPETRPGEFGMYYEKGGKPGFTSFKTQHEAVAARDKYQAQADVKGVRLINPYKNQAPGARYSEASVMHFVDLEQTAFQAAQKVFADDPNGQDKLAEFTRLYTPGTEILKELGGQGIRKNMQERKLVQGREDIDMLSNALNYITSTSRSNAKNFVRSKTLLQSQDPTLLNEPRLKEMFNDHMNAVLDPPKAAPIWRKLRQFTIQYYIGANFSSAASMALQPIQATLPHLTRNGVGVVQGMGYFVGACKTLFNAYGRGKGIENDPMLATAFQKALTDRVVGFNNVLNQFDHNDDAFVSRLQNFANDTGDANMTGSKLLQNTAYQTTRILSYMCQHTIDHNTRVGFISGFNAFRDIGMKKGLVGQDLADYAYSEAKRTVEESLHTGGPAAYPMGFGKVGKLFGVTSTLYALNHFNFSMISIMARYGLEAIGRTGLEGAALHNARKAFGQSLVTQLTLSGAMGLPFAGAAVAMLEQLFPNLQLNRDMRTAISSLAGDDHEAGGILADASLKGLATAFSPVDVSGRLGLGAVVGDDPYYGFNATSVLGASGSMFANMIKGVQQVASGQSEGAMRFLPNAMQRMYKAASDGGAVRNAQGQVVFQPSDAQRVMMAIGLRPKEESAAQEQTMMDNRNQTIQSRQLAQWYQTQEAKITSGDYAGVKTALYQKAQDDPTFSPVVALKRIVAGAQKSQVVQAPVDKGSAAQLQSREQVAQTFGEPSTSQRQPTQVEQLLARSQLEQQVGIPGTGVVGHAELSTARLEDYLMQKYNLDEAQARVLIAQMHQGKQASFRRFHPGAVSPLSALQSADAQTPQQ